MHSHLNGVSALIVANKGPTAKKGKGDDNAEWRLTKDGRIYKKGKKKYSNNDLYDVRFYY